ncbi:MAG: GvpL/GvpF family gas vesicle protein [Eubacteriales bacterium]
MAQMGLYLYCITNAPEVSSFGRGGIENEDEEIFTIKYKDISAVVSNAEIKQYRPTRKNNLVHQGTIEKVMEKYPVLPFRFGIVADNEKGVVKMLESKYMSFKNLLDKVSNKFEMGVKVSHANVEEVLSSIADSNQVIEQLKREKTIVTGNLNLIIEVGKMIERELNAISLNYKDDIFDRLSAFADESIANENLSNEMVLNASFLIGKDMEEAFDKLIIELDAKYENKLNFKCTGPFPPYSFVNIQ